MRGLEGQPETSSNYRRSERLSSQPPLLSNSLPSLMDDRLLGYPMDNRAKKINPTRKGQLPFERSICYGKCFLFIFLAL